jgi:hypothetical protein
MNRPYNVLLASGINGAPVTAIMASRYVSLADVASIETLRDFVPLWARVSSTSAVPFDVCAVHGAPGA